MELEDQVSSIGPSKKLKELGVKQDSLFYYWKDTTHETHKTDLNIIYISEEEENVGDYKIASAFTVAEFGEMLPKHSIKYVTAGSVHYYLIIVYDVYGEVWTVKYERGNSEILQYCSDTKEADARAKMLIYLVEN